jgi:formate C-acetyltransferase
LEILRESVRTFRGQNPVDGVNKAWAEILGSWPADALEAHIKDPDLTSGNFGNSSNTIDFEKILNKGLNYYIEEAEKHMEDFLQNNGQDPDKFLFWKSAVIVCKACIDHAKRYADLARKMAETETDEKRKAELLDIAEVCEYVPANPARNFREACSQWFLWDLAKRLSTRCSTSPTGAEGTSISTPFS